MTFALSDVSEAFQFFDSQNARGRDLEPHDLLKALHLREFSAGDEALKVRTVTRWENSETEELAALFSQYLYRIRNWSKGGVLPKNHSNAPIFSVDIPRMTANMSEYIPMRRVSSYG